MAGWNPIGNGPSGCPEKVTALAEAGDERPLEPIMPDVEGMQPKLWLAAPYTVLLLFSCCWLAEQAMWLVTPAAAVVEYAVAGVVVSDNCEFLGI